MYDLSMRHI